MRKFFSEVLKAATNKKLLLVIVLLVVLMPLVAQADFIRDIQSGIINSVLKPIVYFLGSVLIFLINLLTYLFEYNDFLNVPVVNQGWIVVRDLLNMTFVLMMMAMAIGTILPFGPLASYNYKSTMLKVLIAAITINFSKVILGVIIDACQIVMLQFVSSFREAIAVNLADGALLPQILENSNTGTDGDGSLLPVIISLIAAIVFLIIFVFVILIYALVLLYRIIALWIIIMLSPIMFFAQVGGPSLAKVAQDLWGRFWQQVTIGVTLAFFMWLALLIMYMTDKPQAWMSGDGGGQIVDLSAQSSATNSQTGATDKNVCSSTACEYYNILRFIVAIIVLLQALQYAQKSGGFAGKMAGKVSGAIAAAGTVAGVVGAYKYAKKKKDAVANSKLGKYTGERLKSAGTSALNASTGWIKNEGVREGTRKLIKTGLKAGVVGLATGGMGAAVYAAGSIGKNIYSNFKQGSAKRAENKQELVKKTREAKKNISKMIGTKNPDGTMKDGSLRDADVNNAFSNIKGKVYSKEVGKFLTDDKKKAVDKKSEDKKTLSASIKSDKENIKKAESEYKDEVEKINNSKLNDDEKKLAIGRAEAKKAKIVDPLNSNIANNEKKVKTLDEEIKDLGKDGYEPSAEAKQKVGNLMLDLDKNITTDFEKMAYRFREDLGVYVDNAHFDADPEDIKKEDIATDAGGKAISPLVEMSRNGKRYRQDINSERFIELDDKGVYKMGEETVDENGNPVLGPEKKGSIKFKNDMGGMATAHMKAKAAAGFAMGSAKDKEMAEKAKKFDELDDESLKTVAFRNSTSSEERSAAIYNLAKRKEGISKLTDDEKALLEKHTKDNPMLSKMVNANFKENNDLRQFNGADGKIDHSQLEDAFKKNKIDPNKLDAGQVDSAVIETLVKAKGKASAKDLQTMVNNDAIKGKTTQALADFISSSLNTKAAAGGDVSKSPAIAAHAESTGSLVKTFEKALGAPTGADQVNKFIETMTSFLKSGPNKNDVMKSINEADYDNPMFAQAVEKVNDVTLINAVLRAENVSSEVKQKMFDLVTNMKNESFQKKIMNNNKGFFNIEEDGKKSKKNKK